MTAEGGPFNMVHDHIRATPLTWRDFRIKAKLSIVQSTIFKNVVVENFPLAPFEFAKIGFWNFNKTKSEQDF